MDKLELMKEKVALLNEASKAYYQEDREIMPNIEYDRLYDELLELEKETGVVFSGSPTHNVGHEVLSELPKETHASRMLSLDKTKEVQTLVDWLGNRKGLLSWKLDGLTIVLTYKEGKLFKAVTRGNGDVGEVITGNARQFSNIPLSIPFKGEIVLRGEAVITYSDFESINEKITEAESKYKNPRNLCSGSVRQLNSKITRERNIHFFAFSLVSAVGETQADVEIWEHVMEQNSRKEQLLWLEHLGFETVPFKEVCAFENKSIPGMLTVADGVTWFAKEISNYDVPSDGLVLIYDDIEYGKSLGTTAKFPRDSIAFKWRDEIKETKLLEIEWSASRTGLINPVAIFEPVELEGTTVSRASVHNVSIMKDLQLGVGDNICVYKANMIIPQISQNLTRSENIEIPDRCPVCGGNAEIKNETGVEVLICTNPECLAKQIKSFTHFVSRNAMNIEGLSEATIEKLIAEGLIKELADLFHVSQFGQAIMEMEGFGEKSFNNLCDAVDKARNTTAARLLYSLGIPGIGVANAKLICKAYKGQWDKIQGLTHEELVEVDGIGDIMADSYVNFFADPANARIVADIMKEVQLETTPVVESGQLLAGKTFVITGSLEHFENRDALKEIIETMGGKAAGSVSSKTDYLINNDNMSGSTKNKKARELGIPVITEEEFMSLAGIEIK